jgi:hypothetical protein
MLHDALAAVARHEAGFTSRFSPEELEALLAGLARLHQG